MRNPQLLAAVLALVAPATSHSWIESAHRIAPNGTIIEGKDASGAAIPGQIGYPRGPNRSQPGFTDATHRLPLDGTTYTEKDTLNELTQNLNPPTGLLEASPGDWLAIRHFENGHTTLVDTNPKKPLNRGTIFLYGTTKPATPEMLTDVHMKWNKDGTGGDKRGKLIATRNYDDGQCFQIGHGPIWEQRWKAAKGGSPDKELACQSDIQLPSDLKVGDIYTIYWYWDWPDLNPQEIPLKTTAKGAFPWGGDKNMKRKGFKASMIEKNESYSSTIDIKITDKFLKGGSMMKDRSKYDDGGDVYGMAIKGQLGSNFEVDFEGGEKPKTPNDGDFQNNPEQPSPAPDSPSDGAAPGAGQPPAPPVQQPSAPPVGQAPAETITVSVTETVSPSPIIKTVTVTASEIPASASTKTVTTTMTLQPTTLEKVIATSTSPTESPSPALPTNVFRKPFNNDDQGEAEPPGGNAETKPLAKRTLINSRLFRKRQNAGTPAMQPPVDEDLQEQIRRISENWHEDVRERNKHFKEKKKSSTLFNIPVILGGGGVR